MTKTVTGDLLDSQDRFHIQIKLSDDSIEGTFGDMVFEKGVALIELSHGGVCHSRRAAGRHRIYGD